MCSVSERVEGWEWEVHRLDLLACFCYNFARSMRTIWAAFCAKLRHLIYRGIVIEQGRSGHGEWMFLIVVVLLIARVCLIC